MRATPLNIVVWTLRNIGLDEACTELLNQYEQFLAQIDNRNIREQLASLDQQQVYDDETFLECRTISHGLQAVLKRICFDEQSPLRGFTCEYGVF